MFQGFPAALVPFLMALEANNNNQFFEENRALYTRVLREPLLALAEALSQTVHDIDPAFDIRPARTVSRINRDVRFSKDKSPYRTYMWVGFRYAGEAREETCGFYFDISATAANYGCGYYHMQPQVMQNLRDRIVNHPQHVQSVLSDGAFAERFAIKGDRYVRKHAPPEGLPEPLASLYSHKNVYAEHSVQPYDRVFSASIADEIKEGFKALAPFYMLLRDCIEKPSKEGFR